MTFIILDKHKATEFDVTNSKAICLDAIAEKIVTQTKKIIGLDINKKFQRKIVNIFLPIIFNK